MNSPVGPELPSDRGSGRRFMSKEQYIKLVGQEAYNRQIQRLHARTLVEGSQPAAGDGEPQGKLKPDGAGSA